MSLLEAYEPGQAVHIEPCRWGGEPGSPRSHATRCHGSGGQSTVGLPATPRTDLREVSTNPGRRPL